MASADITISLDDESKDLIRQLIDAVKALHDAPADTSFGDPPRRLIGDPQFHPAYSPYSPYRVTSSNITVDDATIERSIAAMKAVGDRYIEQHGTPVVKDDDYLLPTEHHEGEDTE